MLLNNEWVKQEIKEEIKTSRKTNENENTKSKNYETLRGKFIAIQDYLKKQEKSQINNLTLQPKRLRKRTNKTLNQ